MEQEPEGGQTNQNNIYTTISASEDKIMPQHAPVYIFFNFSLSSSLPRKGEFFCISMVTGVLWLCVSALELGEAGGVEEEEEGEREGAGWSSDVLFQLRKDSRVCSPARSCSLLQCWGGGGGRRTVMQSSTYIAHVHMQ